jgi:hypothetical protein
LCVCQDALFHCARREARVRRSHHIQTRTRFALNAGAGIPEQRQNLSPRGLYEIRARLPLRAVGMRKVRARLIGAYSRVNDDSGVCRAATAALGCRVAQKQQRGSPPEIYRSSFLRLAPSDASSIPCFTASHAWNWMPDQTNLWT